MSQKIEEVLSDNQISSAKKSTFINEVQVIIEKINKENISPESSKWSEFEQEIRGAYTRALMGEKQENNLGEIFALILLQNFSKYINPNDVNAFRENLLKLKNSKDNFEKESIRKELEELGNSYQLLIHIYLFKLIGDNSKNPQIAGRAICVYDELINALDNHNINEVNTIINANSDLFRTMADEGIEIGVGTSIG